MTNIREAIYKKFEEIIGIDPNNYKIVKINLDVEYGLKAYPSEPNGQICIGYDREKEK